MHSSSRHQSTETIRQSGLEFRVTHCDEGISDKPILVLLHGFLGSGEQFRHLMPELGKTCRPVTVDISPVKNPDSPQRLGSSERVDESAQLDAMSQLDETSRLEASTQKDETTRTCSDSRLDTDSLVAGLRETLERIRDGSGSPLALLGYSMGGRLALSLATRHPKSVDGLILESTTAGITDPEQRNERGASDRRKAALIRQDFGKFLEEWDRNPLFHPAPHISRIQRNQDPEIMAKWLEEFGTGVMPSVWDRLGRIRVPVLLITGASDPKFCDLADRIKTQLADARHVVIRGAAHRVHLDRPAEYAAALNDFLSKQIFTG
jgi:2-succinyl-6-hydroxy-2,4-cyclohexadiene-1-carboxylate synthase